MWIHLDIGLGYSGYVTPDCGVALWELSAYLSELKAKHRPTGFFIKRTPDVISCTCLWAYSHMLQGSVTTLCLWRPRKHRNSAPVSNHQSRYSSHSHHSMFWSNIACVRMNILNPSPNIRARGNQVAAILAPNREAFSEFYQTGARS